MFSTLAHELTYSQINKLKPYIYDLYTGESYWFTFEDGDGYNRLVIWSEVDSKNNTVVFSENEDIDAYDVVDAFTNCGSVYGTGKALMLIPELKEEMKSIVWQMFEENMLI